MTPRPRRFKVQYRIDLLARDRSNKPFLLGSVWRTINEADRQATAENLLAKRRHDRPHREFRVAEEWPIGSELRPLIPTRKRRRIPITVGGDTAR